MFSSEFLCKYDMALRWRRGPNSFCNAVALHVQGTEETESSGRIRSESKRKQSNEEVSQIDHAHLPGDPHSGLP